MEWKSRWRKRWVLGYSAYAITEALEEAIFKDKLTREEVKWLYSRIANGAGLFGLLPRRPVTNPDTDGLKDQIRRRVRGATKRSQAMHSCSIVHRKAGKQLPSSMRDRLLLSATAIGVAVIVDGRVDVFSYTEDLEANVLNVEDVCKENDVIYSFQEFPDGDIHPDDVQPFILLEENVKTKDEKGEEEIVKVNSLVAFMDGGFISYHHPESPRSNAWFAHSEWLFDEVKALNEAAKGDMDILTSLLKETRFQKNVRNVCIPRGVVCFAASNGKIIVVQNANQKYDLDAEWGWLSKDPFIWDAEHKNIQPEHVVVPEKEEKVLSTREKLLLAKKQKETGQQTTVLDNKLVDKKKETETTAITTVDTITIDPKLMVKPPANTMKKSMNKQKKWYRFHFGRQVSLPTNLADGLPYARLLDSSPLKKHQTAAALKAAVEEMRDLGDEVDEEEEEEAAATGTSGVPKIPAVVSQPLPIVGPKLKETLTKDVLPKMTLIDVATLDKDDETEPLVTQLDYPFEDMVLWDHISLLEFCRAGNGEAAAILLGNLFKELLNMDDDFKQKVIAAHKPVKTKLSLREQLLQKRAAKTA